MEQTQQGEYGYTAHPHFQVKLLCCFYSLVRNYDDVIPFKVLAPMGGKKASFFLINPMKVQ